MASTGFLRFLLRHLQYIRRYFGNILQGSLVRTGLIQPGVGASSSNNALFTARTPLTARQLYAAGEREDVLNLAYQTAPPGNKAGLYQTALKDSWSTAGPELKAKYEEQAKASALHVNIARYLLQSGSSMCITYATHRNQKDFEENIGSTIQDLCTNGSLGPAEMVLFASFRSPQGELCTFAYVT